MGLRDLINPSHKRDEDVMYRDDAKDIGRTGENSFSTGQNAAGSTLNTGTTADATPGTVSSNTTSKQHTAQSLEPSSGSTAAGTENNRPAETPIDDAATISSIKSGVLGDKPYSDQPEPFFGATPAAQSTPAASSGPSSSTLTGHQSDDISNATYIARTYHLDSGAHDQHNPDHAFRGDPCASGDAPAGPPGYPRHTGGPHLVDTANRLDPHVPGEFPAPDGEDPHASHGVRNVVVGGAAAIAANEAWRQHERDQTAISAPSTGSATAQPPASGSIAGRNVAIGAAGMGLGGVGAQTPANSMHPGVEQTPPGTTAGLESQAAQPLGRMHHHRETDASAHGGAFAAERTGGQKGVLHGLDDQRAELHHHEHDHKLEGAALAGAGAGVVGAGAYEAGKSSHDDAAPTGVHHKSALLNKLDPRVKDSSSSSGKPGSFDHDQHRSNDAAIATAGAGAVGPGAPAKHNSAATNRVVSTAEGGEAPTDASARQRNDLRYAQDVGVGAGAAGLGGLAGYEYEKRHAQQQLPPGVFANQTSAPGQTSQFAQPSAVPAEQQQSSNSRYAPNVGVGAGVAAPAGFVTHEYDNRAPQPSQTQSPVAVGQQTSLPERQRQQPDDSHTGRDAAVVLGGGAAAAGAGAYAVDKHSDKEFEKHIAEQQRQKEKQLKEQLHEHDRELKKETKAAEKAQHQAEKEHDAQRRHNAKILEKEAEKAEKAEKQHRKELAAAEKERAKEEKRHEKERKHGDDKHEHEIAAFEKKHQHQVAEQEKARASEEAHAAKVREHMEKVDAKEAEKEEKDKKPGLLDRILHRDKADKDADKDLTSSDAASPTSRTGSLNADSLYGNDGKLHKEPPRKVKERIEADLAHREAGPGDSTSTGGMMPTQAGFGRDATIEGADSTDPTTGLEGTRAPAGAVR